MPHILIIKFMREYIVNIVSHIHRAGIRLMCLWDTVY